METSFCELKGKEVINIVDGKRLGRIIDLIFDTNCGRILGIVVPAYNKGWNIFKSSDDIFIPFNRICKFGDDAILVQVFIQKNQCNTKKGKILKTTTAENLINTQTIDNNQKNLTENINKIESTSTPPSNFQSNYDFEQNYKNYYSNQQAEQNYIINQYNSK